jgi:hypothetical protein
LLLPIIKDESIEVRGSNEPAFHNVHVTIKMRLSFVSVASLVLVALLLLSTSMTEGFLHQSGVIVRTNAHSSPLFVKKPTKAPDKDKKQLSTADSLRKLFNDNFLLGKPEFDWTTGKPVDPNKPRKNKMNWLVKTSDLKKGGKK